MTLSHPITNKNKQMKFSSGNLYHIYNRGNNKQEIFFETRNYEFFRNKIRIHVSSNTDLIAYCLMPNHFHMLVRIQQENEENRLNKEIGTMLRSFTRAINLQEERTGSLFQQRTQAKNVSNCAIVCFNYIHQNPLKAGIAESIEGWEYSSFNEYLGKSRDPICNLELGRNIIEFKTIEEFYKLSYQNIDPEKRKKIFQ